MPIGLRESVGLGAGGGEWAGGGGRDGLGDGGAAVGVAADDADDRFGDGVAVGALEAAGGVAGDALVGLLIEGIGGAEAIGVGAERGELLLPFQSAEVEDECAGIFAGEF